MARRVGLAERFFRSVIDQPVEARFQTPGRGWRLSDGVGQWLGEVIDVELVDRGVRPRRQPLEPDQSAADQALEEMREAGVEAVALYAPYTYWRAKWGIYVFDDAMYRLASLVASVDPRLGRSAESLVDALLRIVIEHELLHFRVEFAAAHFGVATGMEHYDPYFRGFSCRSGTSDCAEEAIATAVELREGKRYDRRIVAVLADQAGNMPAGYRDHGAYKSLKQLRSGLALLAGRMLGRPTVASGELLERRSAEAHLASVPIRIVITGAAPVRFTGGLLRRVRVHRRPTFSEVRAHAAANARVVAGGRHQSKVMRPGKRPIPLQDHPRIKEVPDRIVGQLARLFDLPREEYLAAVLNPKAAGPGRT